MLSPAPGKALLETAGKARAAPSDSRAVFSAGRWLHLNVLHQKINYRSVTFLNCTYSILPIHPHYKTPNEMNSPSYKNERLHTHRPRSFSSYGNSQLYHLFINTVLIYSTIELHTQDMDCLQSMKGSHSRCHLSPIWCGFLNWDTPRSTPASPLPQSWSRGNQRKL